MFIKNVRKILALVLSCMLLVQSGVAFATAASLSSLEQDLQKLDRELQDLKKQQTDIKQKRVANELKLKNQQQKKETTQQKIDVVEQEILIYKKQIAKLDDKIDKTQQQITLTGEAIALTEINIGYKEQQIFDNNELFKQRLSAMYIAQSSNSYLSLLFGAESFSDFLSAAETVRSISRHDQELLRTLDLQQRELEDLQQSLESQQKNLIAARTVLEDDKADLEKIKAELDGKMSDLQGLLEEQNLVIAQIELVNGELKMLYEANMEDIGETESQKKKQLALVEAARKAFSKNGGYVTVGNGTYIYPLPAGVGYLSSPFGPRWGRMHSGIDLAAASGTPILASVSGVVVEVQKWDGHSVGGMQAYGNMVRLYHPSTDTYTRYAHASSILVSVGQEVNQGDRIANLGTTGSSTGNHLHFEISTGVDNSTRVNPAPYVMR